ncbi:MAG: outer membrane protein assembly factor BamC [Pseudomonadota bacterium]
MRIDRRSIALVLSLSLLPACASKNFREPEASGDTETSVARTFQRSYTDVWNAAIGALGEKKYAIATSKREGGVLITDWISGKSDRLFSGYGDTRIPYSVRFRMTLKLTPTRDGVRVAVRNEEQYLSDVITAGTDFTGSLYQWIGTQSSGAKESSLLASLAESISASSPREKK